METYRQQTTLIKAHMWLCFLNVATLYANNNVQSFCQTKTQYVHTYKPIIHSYGLIIHQRLGLMLQHQCKKAEFCDCLETFLNFDSVRTQTLDPCVDSVAIQLQLMSYKTTKIDQQYVLQLQLQYKQLYTPKIFFFPKKIFLVRAHTCHELRISWRLNQNGQNCILCRFSNLMEIPFTYVDILGEKI